MSRYDSKVGVNSNDMQISGFCLFCISTCSGSCSGSCKGGCSTGCSGSCSGSCKGGCYSSYAPGPSF